MVSPPIGGEMNLDALASAGPAQRSLARLLRTAFADEARATLVVQKALRSAGEIELPEHSEALLEFVKAYLAPLMTPVVGPRLVAALVEDLEAEIEHERAANDPFSSSRMAVSTRMPPPAETQHAPMNMPRAAPPSLSDLVTPLQPMSPFEAPTVEVEVPSIKTAPPPAAPATRRIQRISRPAVILVDADRFGRASLARALVQGQCDVTVLDGSPEVIAALSTHDALDVVVTEVDGFDVDSMLRALVHHRPDVPVLAWTKAARAIAEVVLTSAGVQRYDVMAKSARAGDVVELVRRLAEG